MTEYLPDTWVIIKLMGDSPHYKVLGGWSGGYLDSDRWRMNSGITSVEVDMSTYNFYGYSGSVYRCRIGSYGVRGSAAETWERLKGMHGDKVELMPEGTDWVNIDWIIGKDTK